MNDFLSVLLLLLILAFILIFTPDMYIGSKYRLSVYLIFNNRYRHRPWKTHIGRPQFLITILLCPRRLRESAVIQLFRIKRHLLSVSGFTETYIYLHLSRIICGADKIHRTFINQLSFWHNPFLYLNDEMWGLPLYETFSKLYLKIYIRYLNMLLNCCQSSCHIGT